MPLSYPDEPDPSPRRRRFGRRGADSDDEAFGDFWRRESVASNRGAGAGFPPDVLDIAPDPGPPTAAYPAYPTEPQEPDQQPHQQGAYGGDAYGGDAYGGDAYAGEGYAGEGYGEDYYEDEYEEYAEGTDEGLSRRRGCRVALMALAVLVVAAGIAGWFAWSWAQGQIDPSGGPGETVLVEIPEGASTSDVGHELADAGAISNATVWDWYIRFRNPGEFQAGTYEVQLNSSFTEAIDALEEGALPPDTILITVPEGLTLDQTVARLVDPTDGVEGFTDQAVRKALAEPASRSALLPPDQRNLEGTLLPESYQVEVGTDTPATVIQRMVAQLDETFTELGGPARAEALGRTPYETLIIASLIEEEARTDEDRPRIARVIYNRLAEHMPLQIDATSCYEKREPGGCTLTDADLQRDSPYNTRNRQGLPPTPIASPGRASIEAALNPADGDWLYYVLDAEADDGSHVFTADYDEFIEARDRCRDAGLGCG